MSSEKLKAQNTFVNVRGGPYLIADNSNLLTRISQGEVIEVIPNLSVFHEQSQWVWRRLVGAEERWVAEYNRNTNERLLFKIEEVQTHVDSQPQPPIAAEQAVIHQTADPIRLSPQARIQVDRKSVGFILDGKPFRFVGVNMREFAFYGQDLEKTRATVNLRSLQEDQLKTAQEMGMRVLRFHACHKDISTASTITLVKNALDLAHQKQFLVILVLNDSLDSHFYVAGDQPFHRHVKGHLDKTAYFQTASPAYKKNYLPFVEQIVTALQNHPAIFAWEIGNEYAVHPQPATTQDADAVFTFFRTASQTIRRIDPNHLITTGLINCNQFAPAGQQAAYAKKLYALDTIDFAVVHFYDDENHASPIWREESTSRLDLQVARDLGKPTIVEEFGAYHGNRAQSTQEKMQAWSNLGAVGFMQWGLSATAYDVGIGDNLHGMDPYQELNRYHYEFLKTMYRNYANQLKS